MDDHRKEAIQLLNKEICVILLEEGEFELYARIVKYLRERAKLGNRITIDQLRFVYGFHSVVGSFNESTRKHLYFLLKDN